MYIAYQQNVRLSSFVYLFLNTMSRFDPKNFEMARTSPEKLHPLT